MKTILYKTAGVMRTAVASLIILVAICGASKGENSAREISQNNNELTVQLKSWMGNNTYWRESDNQQNGELQDDSGEINNESNSCDIELSTEMKSWIGNTAKWSHDGEEGDSELVSLMKSWICNSNLWSTETDNKDGELAARIKGWMKSKRYINESDDQFSLGSELAIN